MKITKHFEMGITGKFQSYRVGTTLEQEIPIPLSEEESEELALLLGKAVVESTHEDIKSLLETDPDFRLVWEARKEELSKYAKYLENQSQQKGKM